jgi:protein-S-isoprenylcysteine O-methyltransferase Ste14
VTAVYGWAIPVLWLSWTALWAAWSRGTKPAARRESRTSRLAYNAPLLAGAVLLALPSAWAGSGPLAARWLPRSLVWFWTGAALIAAGLAFAVAARAHIGRNWSGMVTVKQGHELVQTGPYRLVRHPIYAGLLLAFAGTALARGDGRGLAALALVTASFLFKLRVEERFMAGEFPRVYPDYKACTPALVPSLAFVVRGLYHGVSGRLP